MALRPVRNTHLGIDIPGMALDGPDGYCQPQRHSYDQACRVLTVLCEQRIADPRFHQSLVLAPFHRAAVQLWDKLGLRVSQAAA